MAVYATMYANGYSNPWQECDVEVFDSIRDAKNGLLDRYNTSSPVRVRRMDGTDEWVSFPCMGSDVMFNVWIFRGPVRKDPEFVNPGDWPHERWTIKVNKDGYAYAVKRENC